MSAWKWLRQEPGLRSNDEQMQQQQQQEDALFVLGVAGLASKRLLQKHHIPTPSPTREGLKASAAQGDVEAKASSTPAPIVVDVAVANALENNNHFLSAILTPLQLFLAQALARLSHIRQLLQRYQMQKLRSLAALCVRGPISVSRSLWRMGGGRANIARTSAVAVAVAYLFVLGRPVMHFVAS